MSPAQKRLLTARFNKVVLLLDGDNTGRASTVQIANDLAGECSVAPLLLPLCTQPDQMPAEEIRLFLVGEERGPAIRANCPI